MAIDVRQRQYAIGLRDTKSSVLVTENIWTCTGFLGIDEKNGVVFLCHLNTPACPLFLPDLVSDLRMHTNGDLSGFRIYTLGGIRVDLLWVLVLLAGISMVVGQWVGGFCLFAAAILFSLTRIVLRFKLWRLKAFVGDPASLGYSSAWFGLGKCGVRLDAESGKMPETYSYGGVRDHARFKELQWWNFAMTKAAGSA